MTSGYSKILARGALFVICMGAAGAFVFQANPPESARQVEYERWVEAQIHASTFPLRKGSSFEMRDIRITLREASAHRQGDPTTPAIDHPGEWVTVSGLISSAPVVRLLELAKEAKLFRQEPIPEHAGTEPYSVVEVTIHGYGTDGTPLQFRYRGRKEDFESSIPARLLKSLARMWGGAETKKEG